MIKRFGWRMVVGGVWCASVDVAALEQAAEQMAEALESAKQRVENGLKAPVQDFFMSKLLREELDAIDIALAAYREATK